MEDVVIVSAVRTPIASFGGALKEISSPKLGAAAIKEAVSRAGLSKLDEVDECLMGCVLAAGVGQAPARQALIFSGLPQSIRATTINRVCGSGLKAVMFATQMIQTGDARVVIAGGMENMSRTPYLLDKGREGYRLGNGKLIDSMIHDGLWDVYNQTHMGISAELCAAEYKISRADQDHFAKTSYERAQTSITQGKFKSEIVGVEVRVGKEKQVFDQDEEPLRAKLDKLGELKPVFDAKGTVTAANASSLSDGASALVLVSRRYATENGLKPIAKIISQASHAQAPEWFTTAPVGAVKKLLSKTQYSVDSVDLFEINEAFAVVALACQRDLKIPDQKLNIRGGAVALGHPIGASGARILTTLIHTMIQEQKKRGIAAICIGGGEASALMIELEV